MIKCNIIELTFDILICMFLCDFVYVFVFVFVHSDVGLSQFDTYMLCICLINNLIFYVNCAQNIKVIVQVHFALQRKILTNVD